MKSLIRSAVWSLGMFAFVCLPLQAQQPTRESRAEALAAVRAAIGGRDFAAAKANLAAAAKLKGDDAFDKQRLRLEELADYVEKFWQYVDKGGQTLQGTDELMVGDNPVAVVEYANGVLVLRVAGQNRSYTQATMPAGLALAIAKRVLQPNTAANKVYFGAFLCMDSRGDRAVAKKYWNEAAQGGIDVSRLTPELDFAPPPPPIEIPQLTPLARGLLSPKNWTLRVKESRWTKKPQEGVGVQNGEGRLELKTPSGGAVQVVLQRPATPNFACRLIVQNAPDGCAIGLFSADGDDEAFFAPIPKGTVLIEFGRSNGQLACKIAGETIELQTAGKPSSRMPGLLGLSLPAGAELTLAAIEIGVR